LTKHRDRNYKFLLYAAIAIATGYIIAFAIINFFGFTDFCTADMYEDTYIAKLIWEQKTLFPSGWVFGNQLYVIATPVLAAAFYGLTGSMNLSMAFATTVMTILIIISFFWMIHPFVNKKIAVFGVLTLLSCVIGPFIAETIEGQIFYLMASYYAAYLITLCIVFGDYARGATDHSRRFLTVSFILGLVLCFCTGMQSLRQTAIMIVPLLGFEALRLISMAAGKKDLRPLLSVRVLAMAVANVAGLVTAKLMHIPSVSIYGDVAVSLGNIGEKLSTDARALGSITGIKYLWNENQNILLGIFAVLLIIVVLYAFIRSLRKSNIMDDGLAIYCALFTLSMLSVLAVNLVMDISLRSIYLFVWYPLAAVSVCVLLKYTRGAKRMIAAGILCVFAVLNLCFSYLPCIYKTFSPNCSTEKQICEYLCENDYELIYGQWITVANVAAFSDGEIAAGSWHLKPLCILEYINPQDLYSEEDNDKAAYLVVQREEDEFLAYAQSVNAEVTAKTSFSSGNCILYESSKQLMHFDNSVD
jgi:hypothetical protein